MVNVPGVGAAKAFRTFASRKKKTDDGWPIRARIKRDLILVRCVFDDRGIFVVLLPLSYRRYTVTALPQKNRSLWKSYESGQIRHQMANDLADRRVSYRLGLALKPACELRKIALSPNLVGGSEVEC